MEQTNQSSTRTNNDGKSLGIAGLIIGTLSLMFSFIPCIGMWAIIPSIVGVILSSISLSQVSRAGQSKSMSLAGLICSILALLIALYWIVMIFNMTNTTDMFMEMETMTKYQGTLDSLSNMMQQEITITDTVNTK